MKKIFTIFFLLMFPIVASASELKYQELEVARTISAEAGGEGYQGMYLVANVIKNRAIKQNKTPYQIVSAKNQFYGFTAKNKNKLYLEVKKEADYLAKNLMNLPDKTGGAIYFENIKKYGKPKWCKNKTIEFKNHSFYK